MQKISFRKKTERNPCDQSVRDTLPLGTKERTEFDNNCIKYIRKIQADRTQNSKSRYRKKKANNKKTLPERKNPCDEEERSRLDEGSQERKKFDENCRKYIREKNLKFADENIDRLKNSGSYNKDAYNSNRNNSSISNSLLNELFNVIDSELENYINRSSRSYSPSLSFGDAQKRGCNIYGKIKFVEFGEDYKIKFVDNFENLKVKYVEYGEQSQGNWKIVDFGEDYKI